MLQKKFFEENWARPEIEDLNWRKFNMKFCSKKKSIRNQGKHQIALPLGRVTSIEKKSLFWTSCLWFQALPLNNNYSHFSVTRPIFPASFTSWNCNQWKRYWLYDPRTLVHCVCVHYECYPNPFTWDDVSLCSSKVQCLCFIILPLKYINIFEWRIVTRTPSVIPAFIKCKANG